MDDKKLLELAAKAAGIEVDEEGAPFVRSFADNGQPTCEDWNPLTNDGDALRLAVKLKIGIQVDSLDAMATYCAPSQHPMAEGLTELYEEVKADPCAATRRAIVRAAAAIGEQMP